MFVAVMPCKGRFLDMKERVLIMDTEDLSVDYVDRKELDKYYASLVAKNLHGKMFSGMSEIEYVYKTNGIYTAMISKYRASKDEPRQSGLVKLTGKDYWELDGVPLKLWYSVRNLFTVNNIEVPNTVKVGIFHPDLHYAFKFRNYIVLRFSCMHPNWQGKGLMFTCVVDRNERVISAYSEKSLFFGDKAVMTQIEMMTGY